MTEMNDAESHRQGRKAWSKPEIRAVITVDRTRGGFGGLQDQDDLFYRTS